jgi:large subunit ribosomal protein L29
MKSSEQLEELRGLDAASLKKKLEDTEEELMKLRFKHASSQLEKTAQLTQLRKLVARIRTVQTEKQAY